MTLSKQQKIVGMLGAPEREVAMERYWPKWWWRYPFSTGIFSPLVPKDPLPMNDGDLRVSCPCGATGVRWDASDLVHAEDCTLPLVLKNGG